MPLLMRFLMGALLLIVEPVISRIIAALGIGFVSYLGVQGLLTYLENQIASSLAGTSSDIVQILGLMGLGKAMSIVLSALSVRATLAGMNSTGNIVQARWGKSS